jgi:Fusaric acid resistance protein-like
MIPTIDAQGAVMHTDNGETWRRVVGAGAGGLGRVAGNAWPLLQGTAAATTAWVIARRLADHPDPFFAPVAAVMALNASRGERGSNALRLLVGVVVGIVAGELAIGVLGAGYRTLVLATFAAMAVAVALGGARVMVAQAAASAILTVAVAEGQAGPQRLVDALVGAGVALVFTQVLFSPEPVALLRRAEATALTDLAGGLERIARALERDDDELAERAMNSLRDLRDRLAELSRTRRASSRVVRHSLVWRTRMARVVRESEHAGHLDLLGGSCLLLTRTALAMSPPQRRRLAPGVRELAGAIADLARAPGDRPTQQRAADRALDLARKAASSPGQYQPAVTAAAAIQMVATDVMVFAGVDPGQAVQVLREGTGALHVPDPPPASRIPFRSDRRRPTR